MKQNRLFHTLFSVTGVILVSKLLGFVKQMVMASAFGATMETDLISLSQGFVSNLQYLLVQTLLTSFISVYLYAGSRGREEGERFAADVLKIFTLIAAALAAVMLLAAPWLARLLAPTYDQAQSARLATYLRLYAPVLLCFVWMAVFQALLDGNKRFLPGQLESLNQSVLMMLCIAVLRPMLGVRTLIAGFFVCTVWNTVFLGVLSRRYWRLARGNPFQNPMVRELLRMIGPLLLGYSMIYVNQQVDKILVSGLEAGSVTALQYSTVLSNLVSTFIVSFSGILFTYITTRIAQGDEQGAAELVIHAASLMLLLFLPVSILTVLCAEDVVSIAYGRGAFGADSVRIAAYALMGYGISFGPMVLRELFSRFQYGYKDSRTPMLNSTVGILLNIALSIALCPRFGVFGVTFASSVSVIVCGIANAVTARRHNACLRFGPLLRQLPLLAAGGLACVLIARRTLVWMADWSPLLRFAGTTLLAGGGYFLVVSPLLIRLLRKKDGPLFRRRR